MVKATNVSTNKKPIRGPKKLVKFILTRTSYWTLLTSLTCDDPKSMSKGPLYLGAVAVSTVARPLLSLTKGSHHRHSRNVGLGFTALPVSCVCATLLG